MGRCYELTILVVDHDHTKYEAIVDAISDLGYEAYPNERKGQIAFDSEAINMPTDTTSTEVAREIHEAVWKANGAFCKVHVALRDLDDIPSFTGDEATYDEWLFSMSGPSPT